ncbi:MAG TPA: FAD-dependent oxidoreductase [Gemmatimonadaceae bacterium]|jgi:NADPH-dependent 2,4-dienoyl-CoA reductase/sulfur reductase-like enzyme/nitrite reductase/ring-hydroxylating ferredoxin subunit
MATAEGTATKLNGPDLATGIDADALKDGYKLLGHANGEQVLLARVADEYFAIGATCTHYGGPLAEGELVDDTVRCPWHHACFSLRNGEALRAPALNPVSCWRVERRGGRIVVGDKIDRDPLAPSYPNAPASKELSKVIIVGAGAAGTAAAEMLRRCGFRGDVTIIDEDDGSPYDRPNLSKDYLAGNAPEEWIPIRPPGFYDEHRVAVRRSRATKLDTSARMVHVDGAPPIGYDALILATGAEPVRSTTPGADLPHVHYLRSLRDSRAIIAASERATHAVVIGASFIGLEVAASLRTRNPRCSVDVVAPEALPLERVMGRDLGQFIKALHEEHGVVFHLQQTATKIERAAVTLANGERLAADLVVIGVGVRPRLQLAQDAGLRIDKGVVVNEYLETSAPRVYAAGDIARWPDPHSGALIRVEHWVVAERMGQAAARNVLGARERFEQVPFFWSAHYDVSINYVGHAERWDRVDVDGVAKDRDVAVHFIEGDKTRAVATIFRDKASLDAEIAMERQS